MTRRVTITRPALVLLCLIWAAPLPAAPLAAQDVQISNTAKFLGGGRYDWTVFVQAVPAVLQQIEYVEYTLHPSFPNPVRKVTNPQGGFALSANGWGEFNLVAKVAFKSGRVVTLQHWLRLQPLASSMSAVPDHAPTHGALRTRNTSQQAGNGRWNWEIFIEGDKAALDEVRCVKYTLHPTFPEPIQTVCARGAEAGRGFALTQNGWGTFTVGVEITFRDGDIRALSHELTFESPRPAPRK